MTLVLPAFQILVFFLIGWLVYLLVHYLQNGEPSCSLLPCVNDGNCTDINGDDFCVNVQLEYLGNFAKVNK